MKKSNNHSSLIIAKILSNSMYPTFKVGDLVFIKKNVLPKKGDVIGIISTNNIPLIHRFVGRNDFFLFTIADANQRSDNPSKISSLIGKVTMAKINGIWIGFSSDIFLKICFFITQYLSKKIALYPKMKFLIYFRKLVTYKIRAFFIIKAKIKKMIKSAKKN